MQRVDRARTRVVLRDPASFLWRAEWDRFAGAEPAVRDRAIARDEGHAFCKCRRQRTTECPRVARAMDRIVRAQRCRDERSTQSVARLPIDHTRGAFGPKSKMQTNWPFSMSNEKSVTARERCRATPWIVRPRSSPRHDAARLGRFGRHANASTFRAHANRDAVRCT